MIMMRTSTVLLIATMLCAGCAHAAAACTSEQMKTELTNSTKCATDRAAGKPAKGDSKACEYAAKTNSCFTTCACEAVSCDGFSSLPSNSPATVEQNDAYVQGVCDMMSDNNCGSFKCGGSAAPTTAPAPATTPAPAAASGSSPMWALALAACLFAGVPAVSRSV